MNSMFDEHFFESVLNKLHFPNAPSELKLDVKSAVEDGEQYSSEILRVRVAYTVNDAACEKQFILKKSDNVKRSFDVFAKENGVYEKIIPLIEKRFGESGYVLRLAPKCYQSSVEDSYLLLEDMAAESFANIDRKVGLNRAQLEKCIEKVAKWHAATMSCSTDSPLLKSFELYSTPHVRLDGSAKYKTLFQNALSGCIEAFEGDEGMEPVVTRLLAQRDNIFERCCAAASRKDGDWNVLTHGDLWSNNILFNGDNDVLFVDFQMSYFGSPILDLSYLLFTSSSEEISARDLDELLEYYFSEITKAMSLLRIERTYTREEFERSFSEKAIYGAAFSLFCVPMRLIQHPPKDAVLKFLDIVEPSLPFRQQIYSQPRAKVSLKKMLLYFQQKNIFDGK